jgi:hypothetical protein
MCAEGSSRRTSSQGKFRGLSLPDSLGERGERLEERLRALALRARHREDASRDHDSDARALLGATEKGDTKLMKLRFSGSKTLIYACGPGVGGPTSAKPSWLSLSLRRCCHDQPSLVGDPRSLDGRYHSLLLTRNALLAFGPRVRVLS